MDFYAIDIETANQSRHSICQIGVVEVKLGQIISESSYLVQPPNNDYRVYNSMIHGLSALSTTIALFL